jgi:hypothetical protein
MKILLRHLLFEKCIDIIFSQIEKNFRVNRIQTLGDITTKHVGLFICARLFDNYSDDIVPHHFIVVIESGVLGLFSDEFCTFYEPHEFGLNTPCEVDEGTIVND